MTDGPKRLYERGVRWAGKNGAFWYAFATMAEALGKSVRQVKNDMAALESKGLITHTRRRRRSSVYHFLWDASFEMQSTALQESTFEVQDKVSLASLKVQSGAPEFCHKPEPIHHHHEQESETENMVPSLDTAGPCQTRTESVAVVSGTGHSNPAFKPAGVDDDEKPAKPPMGPKAEFVSRVNDRHPEIDVQACFADVQGELRRGAIPFDAFLRRDLIATTNPRALTNPRGYYRGLAQTMVTEHQKQMAADIPTGSVIETPRCENCHGGGYLLERLEGLRPRQTGEFCHCQLGKDLAAVEQRAARSAAISRRSVVGAELFEKSTVGAS